MRWCSALEAGDAYEVVGPVGPGCSRTSAAPRPSGYENVAVGASLCGSGRISARQLGYWLSLLVVLYSALGTRLSWVLMTNLMTKF